MNKTIFATGILFGILAVLFGAFGAHGLEQHIGPESVETFETGVRYQMYHALLLLILANTKFLPERTKKPIFLLVVTGIVLFSFSIYVLATNNLTGFDFRKIALLTPLGGSLLIISWILTGIKAVKRINE